MALGYGVSVLKFSKEMVFPAILGVVPGFGWVKMYVRQNRWRNYVSRWKSNFPNVETSGRVHSIRYYAHSWITLKFQKESVFPSILPCLVALDVIGMVSATSREGMVFTADFQSAAVCVKRMNDLRYGDFNHKFFSIDNLISSSWFNTKSGFSFICPMVEIFCPLTSPEILYSIGNISSISKLKNFESCSGPRLL